MLFRSNDFMKVLNKEDEFITYDDQLEDTCSHGFNKDLGKEEKIAREIEKKYSINYMRDIIQQDRSLSASFLSYSPKYIWNKSRLSNNQNLIKKRVQKPRKNEAKTAPRGLQKTGGPRHCWVLAAKKPQDAPKTR